MIEEYLKKKQEKLFDEKLDSEKSFVNLENRIKEIDRFIELLEEKIDPNFESFTPRDVEAKNKASIQKLKSEKAELQGQKDKLKQKVDNLKLEEKEIQSLLHSVKLDKLQEEKQSTLSENQLEEKTNILPLDILSYVSREKQIFFSEIKDSIIDHIPNLIQKLKLASQFIELDRERAKIELHQLITQAEELKYSFDKVIINNPYEVEDFNLVDSLKDYVRNNIEKNHCKISISMEETLIYNSQSGIGVFEILKNLLKLLYEESKIINISMNADTEKKMNPICISVDLYEPNRSDEIIYSIKSNQIITMYTYLLSLDLCFSFENDYLNIVFEIADI